MKILFAGFKGINNSSKILLDAINAKHKLYLENDKQKSCRQMKDKLCKDNFDFIFIFGQKPLLKNKVSIELLAKNEQQTLKTNFHTEKLTDLLKKYNLKYTLTTNPGNSYCNNIYFFTLDFLSTPQSKPQCLFIHLPFINKFDDIDKLISILNGLDF